MGCRSNLYVVILRSHFIQYFLWIKRFVIITHPNLILYWDVLFKIAFDSLLLHFHKLLRYTLLLLLLLIINFMNTGYRLSLLRQISKHLSKWITKSSKLPPIIRGINISLSRDPLCLKLLSITDKTTVYDCIYISRSLEIYV